MGVDNLRLTVVQWILQNASFRVFNEFDSVTNNSYNEGAIFYFGIDSHPSQLLSVTKARFSSTQSGRCERVVGTNCLDVLYSSRSESCFGFKDSFLL